MKDYPGLVSNDTLLPTADKAACASIEGIGGSREAIGTVMELGMSYPMRLLALADFTVAPIDLNILQVVHDGLGDPKCRVVPS